MTDVAKLANVSYQTVSRVVHGHPNVRAATRTRILLAIDQLGFKPNVAAQALVTGQSRTLGMIALDAPDWSGLSTLYGIEKEARNAGYFVSLATLTGIERTSIREATAHLVGQSVAGILIIAPVDFASDALVDLPENLPAVAIEGDPGTKVAVVTVDQVAGARMATEHLLEAGHKTVFHLAGPTDWRQSRERVTGWREALERAGAEITTPLSGDWTARSGYEVGRMLARMPDVTAVFSGNDQMALGLMRALSERNRRVPDDVSIVGFDDIPEAAYYTPPLTTVHQDFAQVGRTGLELLLAQVESGARRFQQLVIGTELVIRQSVASPPVGLGRDASRS
jgi:DNA-binding LacI/PurR family transcriptional regulator